MAFMPPPQPFPVLKSPVTPAPKGVKGHFGSGGRGMLIFWEPRTIGLTDGQTGLGKEAKTEWNCQI